MTRRSSEELARALAISDEDRRSPGAAADSPERDPFGRVFLKAGSRLWVRLFGAVGLLAFLVFISFPDSHESMNRLVFSSLIVIAVSGVMSTWFLAIADAANRGRKRWQIAVFCFWPLAYWYVYRELEASKSTDMGT